MRHGASAPGKVILCGEYAVLEGTPAVVAAVDRRVSAVWTQDPAPELPAEASKARTLAEEVFGAAPGHLAINRGSLSQAGRKLGLGSSSAAAVASAGAVADWHGHDLHDEALRHTVFEIALAGHHAVAPQGSGVDIASAAFGGVIRFQKDNKGARVHPLSWPKGLHASVIWTGSPVRTSDLVRAVLSLRDKDVADFESHMVLLSGIADEFVRGFELGDVTKVCDAAEAYAVAMEVLGTAAGVTILNHPLRKIGQLARDAGGAAKPSGAGGGDIAVAFFTDPDSVVRFEDACRAAGMTPLNLKLGAPGVQPLRAEP